jgi:hypothetical protein
VQLLQNPNQSNVDNLNNVRHDSSRHFRNKKKEYLKAKINELETKSKNKNIRDLYRGISYIKKGYQPRNNVVKDEKGDLVADSHSILARWRNHFFQLFNVHGLIMLGRLKYKQQSHWCLRPVTLRLRWLLKS